MVDYLAQVFLDWISLRNVPACLIAPAISINKELREYKMEQEVVLQDRLTEIRKGLEDNQSGVTERKDFA